MNHYFTSDGERVSQSTIDSRTREAKAKVLQNQRDEYGYNFCEECGANANSGPLDCSHDVSVKKAKETGRTELCWDTKIIVIRCRNRHKKKDGLDLQFSNN
ncbi:hypothetical protein [Muricauda sp. MAR_2010_75]|uniref:hypothetical protein n=1 Tax=Allomuricauda sp. MAR_2010_75 TaxID=1250232 RepID=UPI00056A72A9|nr:hypothetical protein [Muricauda sp. MAR_2010_75]